MSVPARSSALRPAAAQPSLVWCPHPLLATAGREFRYEAFQAGESVEGYLARLGYRFDLQPVVLYLNGTALPRAEWALTFPKNGDLIAARALVHGGGEEGGKNPIATILSIVIIIVAPYAAPALAGVLGVSTAVAGALIVMAGNLLINALFPPLQPKLSDAREGRGGATYALTGASNRARPYEPLLRVLGKHRVYPDLGAQYYTEYEGNEQYLNAVFHFGISDATSDLLLSNFRIGNTPVTDFDGIEIQQSGSDGKLTLFPVNVDTVTGGTLTRTVDWVQKTSSTDTVMLAFEVAGVLYQIDNRGTLRNNQTVLQAEYRQVGSTSWLPVGEFDTTAYHTHYWSAGYYRVGENDVIERWIQATYGSNNPSDHVQGETYFDAEFLPNVLTWRWRPYTEINDGDPNNAYLIDPAPSQKYLTRTNNIELENRSRSPMRFTLRVAVPRGQYECRMRTLTQDSTEGEFVSQFAWTQLRSYQADDADYSGQKRVAVRVRASGQLQGVLDTFNADASARCEVWTGTQWGYDETSNPAWWMLAVMRGGKRAGRRAWGCGVADTRIDFDALKAFGAWCKAKKLSFDGVIDQRMNCVDLLNAIARAGRGSLSMANGKYGVVWDAPNQPIVQMFGLGNIKADSFEVKWVSEKLGDEIIVNFVNRDKGAGYEPDSVRALVPGVVSPVNPVTIEVFGIVDPDQIQGEVNLIAAAQYYRRRFCTFESDFEGQVVKRGDVVGLSHHLFAASQINAWGYSGRLVSGSASVLTLDSTVTMSATQTNYCAVRSPDGTVYVRAVVYAAGDVAALTLAAALPFSPDADAQNKAVDYLWFFGLDAQAGVKKFKVHDCTPKNDKDVTIVVTDESPEYYAQEYVPATFPGGGVVAAQMPVVSNIQFTEELERVGNAFVVRLGVQWDTAGVADHYNIRVWVDGVPAASPVSYTRGVEVVTPALGLVTIEILPVHPVFGASTAATAIHDLVRLRLPPADVPWLSLQGNRLAWGVIDDLTVIGYRFRFNYGVNVDWGVASPLHDGLITESPIELRVRPSGVVTIMGKAVTTLDVESSGVAFTVINLGDALVANVVETIDLRALAWPGDVVGGAQVSGDLAANDATLRMWAVNENAAMWSYDSNLMWNAQVWAEMYYLTQFTPTLAGAGSLLTVTHEVEGAAYSLEYRRNGPGPMWTQDSELMWSVAGTDLMWSLPPGDFPNPMWSGDPNLMWKTNDTSLMWTVREGGYQSWPGAIEVVNEPYDFRVTTAFGPVRGMVKQLTFVVDAPDESESFKSVSIGAAGSRLPITKAYRSIKGVSGAVESDGGSARGFTVEDYDAAAGPLIKTRDASGAAVSGKFTGTIQGVRQ